MIFLLFLIHGIVNGVVAGAVWERKEKEKKLRKEKERKKLHALVEYPSYSFAIFRVRHALFCIYSYVGTLS